MPDGDPFEIVPTLLDAEARIRRGEAVIASDLFAETNWADIVRLIQVFRAREQADRLSELKGEFVHPAYREYLEGLRLRTGRRAESRKERL